MKRLKTIIICSIALCAVVVLLLIIICLKRKKKYQIYLFDEKDDPQGRIASNMNLIINASFSGLFRDLVKNFKPDKQTAQALLDLIQTGQEQKSIQKDGVIPNVLNVVLVVQNIKKYQVLHATPQISGGIVFTYAKQKCDVVLLGNFILPATDYLFKKYIYVHNQSHNFQLDRPAAAVEQQYDRFQIESGLLRCGQYSKQYGAFFFYDDKVDIIFKGEKKVCGMYDGKYDWLIDYINSKTAAHCQICGAVYVQQ